MARGYLRQARTRALGKDVDPDRVQAELAKWQSEKNTAILNRMFGEYRAWLARPKKMLSERDDLNQNKFVS